MSSARRRAVVGLVSLALVASAQVGIASGASAADAPTPTASAAPDAARGSAPAAVQAAAAFTASPRPTITGTAQVSSPLTAVTGTWTPAPDSFSYRWWRDGVAISGATAARYVPVAADQGKRITVTVTAAKSGYASLARSSGPTAAVTAAPAAQPFTAAPVPTITGTATIGSPLTAVPGTWSPSPRFAYQWFVGDKPIFGATASTYTPTYSDLGRALSVSVAGYRDGYATTVRMSAPTPATVGRGTLTTAVPTITGSAVVGSALRAVPNAWSPDPTFEFRWFADDEAISNATGEYYTPVAADIGKRITVTVTGSAAGYNPAARTSARTAAVVAATTPPPVQATGTIVGRVYLDSVAPGNLISSGEVTPFRVGAAEATSSPIVDGAFRAEGLLPGDYRLAANVTVGGQRLYQYYGEADGVTDGRTFTVQADGTVRLDVVLKRYATISGTATLADGRPAVGSQVEVFRVRGGEVSGATTDASGRFVADGLTPGQYEVHFTAPFTNPDGVIGEWYSDTDDRNAATRFTVGWGQAVTGVDPTLDAGSRLSGIVRAPDGSPYAGARVYVVPEAAALLGADPRTVGGAPTDATGRFRITGILPGRYYVFVAADRSEAPSYASQWLGGSGSLASATVYTATRRADLPSVDARFVVSSSVTATISGTPAAGWSDHAQVTLFQGGTAKRTTFVDPGMDAFLDSVPAGTYRVQVTYFRDYVPSSRWWDGGTGADRSELVVPAGKDVALAIRSAPAVVTTGTPVAR
ncbi:MULTISPECIES: carboxypeptidase regulatory-like domain-containing protein [Clavibacter]|uniref:alpha-amylase n=2 Tax=Clavibacter TaxID=1573 RepID=A0ABY3TCU9_9MICO|nr:MULTISPECIES: carboxypeptidase regulatory-like domain-containing protein [Clavibacter]KDP91290.1 surface-anchored protein [Clavibacter cf. michiganensis LMG 26808]UKF25503.1 carboxypeptidase-like regulatory domain-containing protein [Clavibacter sp. A6099]